MSSKVETIWIVFERAEGSSSPSEDHIVATFKEHAKATAQGYAMALNILKGRRFYVA